MNEPCDWYKGKAGFPDTKKCKQCPHSLTCLGRNVIKWVKQAKEKI